MISSRQMRIQQYVEGRKLNIFNILRVKKNWTISLDSKKTSTRKDKHDSLKFRTTWLQLVSFTPLNGKTCMHTTVDFLLQTPCNQLLFCHYSGFYKQHLFFFSKKLKVIVARGCERAKRILLSGDLYGLWIINHVRQLHWVKTFFLVSKSFFLLFYMYLHIVNVKHCVYRLDAEEAWPLLARLRLALR